MESNIDYRLIFSLMSGRVSNVLNRRLNENFQKADLPITADHWNVLLTLTTHNIATQQQICDDTSLSKTTMTRLVNQLEDLGILERFKSRADWRANYLRLTPQGVVIRNNAQYIASKTLRDALKGLTIAEVLAAQKGLNTVMENLARQPETVQTEEISQLMKYFNVLHKNRRK